jgi:predicted 2-oxoglutarate/Fe(II)-dependent dioxygenase YbiX
MLRFLRYEEGQHFNLHCDATYNGGGGEKRQKSFLTLHLYLTDDESSSLKGGSTRFWSPDEAKFMDVEAKRGRVWVFQQRTLWHSGEPVTEGTKITMRSDIMFEWVSLKPPRPKGEKKKGGRVDKRVESVKQTMV